MVAASTFPVFDKLMGGTLCADLKAWRAETPPRSYEAIAAAIEERTGLRPGRETARRWVEECDA